MANLVSSIFVLAPLVSYSLLLLGLDDWILHSRFGARVKKRISQNDPTRCRFLRLLQCN